MKPKVSAVFLNVPFDKAYEKYFLALIAAVVSVGRAPRTVLELPEHGQGRLSRLVKHLHDCELSLHDLSRVGTPVRFNMPFELGLACALSHFKPPHAYVLLERKRYRLDQTLSDIKGRDPYVYGESVRRLIASVIGALRRKSGANPLPQEVFGLYMALCAMAKDIKRRSGSGSLYERSVFEDAVAAATLLAADAGFISGPGSRVA